jgi:hypothetical protein
MAVSHGRLTKVTIATKDVSPYIKTSTYERGADVHDTTGYGVADKKKAGGLRETKFTCSGVYDNTVSVGPRIVLHGNEGTTMPIVRNVEGTGTGKPNDAFNAVLAKYTETNPVDDMVTWSADFEIDGAVTTTALP